VQIRLRTGNHLRQGTTRSTKTGTARARATIIPPTARAGRGGRVAWPGQISSTWLSSTSASPSNARRIRIVIAAPTAKEASEMRTVDGSGPRSASDTTSSRPARRTGSSSEKCWRRQPRRPATSTDPLATCRKDESSSARKTRTQRSARSSATVRRRSRGPNGRVRANRGRIP
jgi:hypothetical protein